MVLYGAFTHIKNSDAQQADYANFKKLYSFLKNCEISLSLQHGKKESTKVYKIVNFI